MFYEEETRCWKTLLKVSWQPGVVLNVDIVGSLDHEPRNGRFLLNELWRVWKEEPAIWLEILFRIYP